jgi:uncharacterized protein
VSENSSGNILITGASGLIGSRLTEILSEKGYHVFHLSRSKKNGNNFKSFVWNVERKEIDPEALKNIDTIIHLAGAGIADKRWTDDRKKEIVESRTQSTKLLFDTLKLTQHGVKNFISASAIGYYGFEDNERLFTETDEPGKDFLATVVKKWEDEVDRIELLNIRVVKIRVGIVLSEKGGALKEMVRPVKLLAGAPLGSGKQNISWIHLDDVCSIFVKAVEDNKMKGAYNGVAPGPVSNRELTKRIARVLNKPMILPAVPAFVLKVMFGEMAVLVLFGNKVSGEKIQRTGFQYKFTNLDEALINLLK